MIELRLTEEQHAVLEPILRAVTTSRQNVLFIATAAPDFADGCLYWRLQVKHVSPRTGAKLLRLPRSEKAGGGTLSQQTE